MVLRVKLRISDDPVQKTGRLVGIGEIHEISDIRYDGSPALSMRTSSVECDRGI